MHPVQKHLFDTNFRDLAGTKLEGTLALSDEIINLGLGELLSQLRSAGEPANKVKPTTSASEESAPLPDPKALAGLLDVGQLDFRTEKGRTLLDVKLSLKS
ncbi:MAG: hypothetical protein AAFN92_15990 [Bacteroidota bacterium]